jgi:syntaxin-binding protein 1
MSSKIKPQKAIGDRDSINTLRYYARNRILVEMLDKVKEHAINGSYLIMVVDNSALKVFSSCCKFFDLYSHELFHVELLSKKRKRFQNSDGIYFISPTAESIDLLIEDYSVNSKST